jgi:phosphoglycolate phosphatase-like HAD superfamily hydrolase
MQQILLFDIDGTLINTQRGVMQQIVHQAIENAGYLVTKEKQAFSGRTDTDIFRSLTLTPEYDVDRTKAVYFAHLEKELQKNHINVIDHVESCLASLIDSKHSLGILTGNYRESATIKLTKAGLHNFFNWEIGAYGCDHAERNFLPNEAYKRTLAYLKATNIPAHNFWIIGDTPNDIACAKYFGAKSIAVSTGYFSSEQLAMHKPDYLVENLSSLAQIIGA